MLGVASMPARAAPPSPSITAQPQLQPAFDPAVHDYVTRCEPAGQVTVSVTAGSVPVSVAGAAPQTGSFNRTLQLSSGRRFTIAFGGGDYNVRCLPQDFPTFTASRTGTPQAAYYLATPSIALGVPSSPPYVALFDDNGVPVWWYRSPSGTPLNAQLLADGSLAWNVETGEAGPFGQQWGDVVEERDLNGTLVRTLRTWFTPTDFHESAQLPNGDLLMTSYALQHGADLTSIGILWPVDVLNATFQEIQPNGVPDYAWSSQGRLQPAESLRWWDALFPYPWNPGLVWDWQHINSVAEYADGFLVSMRHTDAVYMVRRSDGAIEWKLGGTTTPQSLTIAGDPDSSADFGGQHDARALADGTVSVLDNGTARNRPPRVLRFRIDARAHSATLIQRIDPPPDVTASPCCGSARLLPGSDWVIDWGGTGTTEEVTASGHPVFRLDFAPPIISYRVVPILPGRLSSAALTAAMDRLSR